MKRKLRVNLQVRAEFHPLELTVGFGYDHFAREAYLQLPGVKIIIEKDNYCEDRIIWWEEPWEC